MKSGLGVGNGLRGREWHFLNYFPLRDQMWVEPKGVSRARLIKVRGKTALHYQVHCLQSSCCSSCWIDLVAFSLEVRTGAGGGDAGNQLQTRRCQGFLPKEWARGRGVGRWEGWQRG